MRDKVAAGTLRMALAAITNAEVAGDTAKELSDDETLKVVAKEAKKRNEAIEAYQGAGREDLAAKESAELVVLEAYLPAQLSDAEIAAIVVTGTVERLARTSARRCSSARSTSTAARRRRSPRACTPRPWPTTP